MSDYTIEGQVIKIGEEQIVGDNFKKRELIVKTEGQYPQEVLIEFVKDKTDLLDIVLPNQKVTVHFNLRGRKYSKAGQPDKWFNTISGWKIDTA